MANTPPIATINNRILNFNEWAQVQNWISYSDADGNAAVKYQFWDSGAATTSGYFWTPANAHYAVNTVVEVAAADIANTWVRGGTVNSAETMWVRAFDGTDWGAWDTFTLTTNNTPPVAIIADHSVHINEWTQVQNWLSFSDADGDAASKYQFWDSGSGATSGYFWTPANAHYAANTVVEVAAADIANTWVRGGTNGGSETLWVRAFDGKDWGAWDTFTLTTIPNATPVATISDHSVHINEWTQVQNWLSYSDADAEAAVKYQFWDSGSAATSGYFWTPANSHHAANTVVEVAAADIANTWVRGGMTSGSETLWVRAFDGKDWGAWDTFNFTTVPNATPVVTISNHSARINEWAQVQIWLGYSDADGDAATKYQFWDGGSGANSGYLWTPDNAHHSAGTAIEVAAANLATVWVRGGAAGGVETFYARAFDGSDWGAWDSFNFTTLANTPPVATATDHSLHLNEWAQVQSWVGYSDADGNAATKYQFWDGGSGASSGYFWTPDSAHHPAGTAIEVLAADLANVWVRGGTATGTETLYVRGFDGNDWSAWDSFLLQTLM